MGRFHTRILWWSLFRGMSRLLLDRPLARHTIAGQLRHASRRARGAYAGMIAISERDCSGRSISVSDLRRLQPLDFLLS